ncbi:MAG: thioesterase family protein [Ilumatobacter sp.]|nr:thioesterase family protein [Ilumatobacter sp.]
MSHFEDETAIAAAGDGAWTTELTTDWDIGDNANGGYAIMSTLRALQEVGGHPDPLSVTSHFLRPVQGGGPGRITADLVRRGRTVSVARGTLHHDGKDRLMVTAAMGDLATAAVTGGPAFEPEPPSIPGPDDCVNRSGESQGVDLAIATRCDMRLPGDVLAGGADDAVMHGWIRLVDGTEPSTLALALFADAFPPSLFATLGRIGWVPTIELTVHVRRRPAAGWIQGRFECDDLVDGRMIETGTLWDSEGHVVARSRQLGLLLSP